MEDPLKMPKENEKSIGILKKQLKRHFPILTWLPSYKKSDLVADFIAGLTLGLTMIPQSVAYASLAGIPGEVRWRKIKFFFFFAFSGFE